MPGARPHLHLVEPAEPPEPVVAERPDGALEDLALTATIFAVSFLPLAGAAAHLGHWGSGTLGLATLGSLFAGRELWNRAVEAIRTWRRP
jgi:hypothetical protein